MKATLQFDLPEDNHEFQAAINGAGWQAVVYDLHASLSRHRKSAAPTIDVNVVMSELAELMQENRLFFD